MPLRIAAKMTEPAEREYFTAHVAPYLGGDIEYVGELRRTEKYDLLREAVCLLNPIRWDEPFGMVMIEAMACGTLSSPTIVDRLPKSSMTVRRAGLWRPAFAREGPGTGRSARPLPLPGGG